MRPSSPTPKPNLRRSRHGSVVQAAQVRRRTLPNMRLGDVVPGEGPDNGKPLDGIRVLAAEQMQALPYATQLLGRLGAEVVKVEHPVHGESGRGATPAMEDP